MVVMIGAAISPRMMPALSTFKPTGHVEELDDQGIHDAQSDETPDHRGDGRQQLHQDLEGLPGLAGGELTDVDRRTE